MIRLALPLDAVTVDWPPVFAIPADCWIRIAEPPPNVTAARIVKIAGIEATCSYSYDLSKLERRR